MTKHSEDVTVEASTWQLKALTEALGDLTLTVSDSLTVGRGSDNDVVLGSKQVSRNHALLTVLNGKLYVKDLESSNGTFINDARIEGNQSKHLKADDTVAFASFSFLVSTPSAATDSQQSAPVIADETTTDKDLAAEEAVPTAEVDSVAQETKADEAIADDAVVDELQAKLEPTASVEPVVQDTVSSEPVSSEPVVKETAVEEILPTNDSLETTPAATESVAEPAVKESVTKEPALKEPALKESAAKEPVVKETGVEDVLTDKNEPTSVKSEPAATPTSAPASAADGQDKTTTTPLQEEADPDVLRAKQAATAQLSGTANLGQPRDVGTEGNNAMDQALNNPANAGQTQKKPSGNWFIWVFAIIIIIALALWLFNTGAG